MSPNKKRFSRLVSKRSPDDPLVGHLGTAFSTRSKSVTLLSYSFLPAKTHALIGTHLNEAAGYSNRFTGSPLLFPASETLILGTLLWGGGGGVILNYLSFSRKSYK